MNRPVESQFTELLIVANTYRQFVLNIANDQYGRVSPGLREEARRILSECDHPALNSENYQG